MQAQIERLIEDIKSDYRTHMSRVDSKSHTSKTMIQEFEEGVSVSQGRKYIKILHKLGTQTMVWGFVVNTDTDKKFRRGDILKPAGFNAPARNQPRGNILDGDYSIRWTGPLYL